MGRHMAVRRGDSFVTELLSVAVLFVADVAVIFVPDDLNSWSLVSFVGSGDFLLIESIDLEALCGY
jgi:hypothetical protein